MTRCETLRRSCNINLAQPRPAPCKASSGGLGGVWGGKCGLATGAPSRPIESFDASSEAGVGILKFICTRRASVMTSAKVRG